MEFSGAGAHRGGHPLPPDGGGGVAAAVAKGQRTSPSTCWLGNLALVGIPGEVFARLGLEIRRRSPFRHTCIVGLANAYLGYVPDRKAYADGGYQTWAAWQSAMEVGTGEAIVGQAVAMLDALYNASPPQRHDA